MDKILWEAPLNGDARCIDQCNRLRGKRDIIDEYCSWTLPLCIIVLIPFYKTNLQNDRSVYKYSCFLRLGFQSFPKDFNTSGVPK